MTFDKILLSVLWLIMIGVVIFFDITGHHDSEQWAQLGAASLIGALTAIITGRSGSSTSANIDHSTVTVQPNSTGMEVTKDPKLEPTSDQNKNAISG